MDKKEAARELMQIVETDLATARGAVEGQQSWQLIDEAMTKLRRIASILDHKDKELPKPANRF
ncbi:hypothetical protein BPNPMPFG_008194 (plasmid) [Mesorhizobium sp. AR07]|uniref:hypothetical protein n=1 Tax=Mesorhizobium sp. AR07 TaxID=2865838 RepID=UPI00215FCDAA|nr:hypothetical protein [Mesorhizobium sp. AR07]UVK49534.1 hypothetical protein BPNPMPFG_008194 [Mesorhizobium sp. AR07]